MDIKEAIRKYIETFNEGPPILEMEDAEALHEIEKAIETNTPISDTKDLEIPKGAIQ